GGGGAGGGGRGETAALLQVPSGCNAGGIFGGRLPLRSFDGSAGISGQRVHDAAAHLRSRESDERSQRLRRVSTELGDRLATLRRSGSAGRSGHALRSQTTRLQDRYVARRTVGESAGLRRGTGWAVQPGVSKPAAWKAPRAAERPGYRDSDGRRPARRFADSDRCDRR